MTIKDAINRTNNLVGTTIVGLAGFAFLPEVFVEDERSHKIDEGLLFVLGIIAIIWYRMGNNRYSRTLAPIIFVVAAFVIKLLGIYLEFGDQADMGDEFGALILFILSIFVVSWIYIKSKKLIESA